MRVALVICTISAVVALASAMRYHANDEKLSYADALLYCQARNDQLALPHSEKEITDFHQLMISIIHKDGLIGATTVWLGAVQAFVNNAGDLVDVSPLVKSPEIRCAAAMSIPGMGLVPTEPRKCDDKNYVICESE